jgi:Domain of unknown function (DUF4394)
MNMKLFLVGLAQTFKRTAFYVLMIIALASNIAQAKQESNKAGDDSNRRGRCGDGWSGHDRGNRADNLEVVGLTSDQRLICFDEKHPEDASNIGSISGLAIDTNIVGIDFRPATGDLYALGNAGGVYTLSLDNGQATLRSRLNVALSGSFFGVDFNPTVDRLRIISDVGQNLRANVETGATNNDGPINYTGPATNGVTAVAYTNNDSDPNTVTTLYDIDSLLDQVAIQAPPNAGTLNPTGKLNVDTTADVGFDIYSTVVDGSTISVRGLASLITSGRPAALYDINLFTGKASFSGAFSSQNVVIDLAVPLNQF